MVLALEFVGGKPFSSFDGDTSKCHIETGVSNYNRLNPVTCELDNGNSQIIIRNVGFLTGSLLKVYYAATLINAEQANTQVQIRLYANSQSFDNNAGWAIYISTTSNTYNLVDMYYHHDPGYDYNSQSYPGNFNGNHAKLYDSSWADTSGFSKIISVSTSSITIRVQRNSNWNPGETYRIGFRFYTERIQGAGSCTLTSLTKNGGSHGIPNFQNGGCSFHDRHVYMYITTESNSNHYFPFWYAGEYYDFTFSASSSFSGDITNNPNLLFASTTIAW
jgi:hypothetical protein